MVALAAFLGFIVGFAYGNVLGLDQTFVLRDWQSLAGTIVAVVAAGAAYFGVKRTQRITVILKEQERLDKALPGLRQTNDFLGRLVEHLVGLSAKTRYLSIVLIRDYLQFKDGGETFEQLVDRRIPLGDDETKREVTGLIVSLVQGATTLQLAKEEHTRSFEELAQIDTFAEESKAAVRQQAERIDSSLKRVNEDMGAEIQYIGKAAADLQNRLKEAQHRRDSIAQELDHFFSKK